MKKLVFAGAALALLLPSCARVALSDQAVLNRTAMKFDAKGARLSDCSLVNQVEKGRALSNTSAGGGCASCQ
ncbi:MAG: hypothetical protein ABGZ49_11020 [Akkermansiaceae bacterium]|jgi:hypothetical protein|nr:hypothetical protein [Roseibacillus sp.]